MIIKTVPAGPLEANCYIVLDPATKKAMVVDPGDEPDRIEELTRDLDVLYIVLSHAHFDHVGAVAEIKKATGAKLALHEEEVQIYETARDQALFWGYELDPLPEPDLTLKEGDELRVGGLIFRVLHTPGHSPGGICLYGEGVVFTGDTLFAGSVGRTDFPGGDMGRLKASFRRLMGLPEETRVLSGHGPPSTIGEERSGNPFSMEFGI
jgi:glyoxylase-like metal-dependent hydrolase (beta-lactamase superfamily II)